jgi:hypothetical protein
MTTRFYSKIPGDFDLHAFFLSCKNVLLKFKGDKISSNHNLGSYSSIVSNGLGWPIKDTGFGKKKQG